MNAHTRPRLLGVVIALLLPLLLTAAAGRAEKMKAHVTPRDAAQQGFAVTTRTRADSTVEFKIVRGLSKAQWPGLSAELELRSEAGLLARCPVRSLKLGPRVTYRFDVARSLVGRARFTVIELQTAENDPEGEKLLGGGTYFEFDLPAFLNAAPVPAAGQ